MSIFGKVILAGGGDSHAPVFIYFSYIYLIFPYIFPIFFVFPNDFYKANLWLPRAILLLEFSSVLHVCYCLGVSFCSGISESDTLQVSSPDIFLAVEENCRRGFPHIVLCQ